MDSLEAIMNIYYDYQIFISQKYGGVSRYFYELTDRIEKIPGNKIDVKCIHNVNYYFKDRLGKMYPEMPYKMFKAFSVINHIAARNDLKKDYDIIHPTFNDPYLLGHYKGKLVVTIHDMIHELYCDKYPENLSRKDIDMKKLMIENADHIITISENTKKDILHFYPDTNPDNISIIYHGSDGYIENIPFNNELPEKYILFVGQRRNYKNFEGFVKAMKPLLDDIKDLKVLCLGAGSFTPSEKELIGNDLDRYIQMGCSDELLKQAYHQARCFVFPSIYEGFGIPTLEAMSAGCPVAISNTSSMPEVGGNAASYFNPENIQEMTDAIYKVISDDNYRNSLIQAGIDNLKRFDWQETAEKTLQCYKDVLK